MTRIIMEGGIGAEVTAQGIREELDRAGGDDVEIMLNSPGGSVWEGYSIFDSLASYSGRVVVKIVGLAGSIASYLMLAADRIVAQDQASVMIHDPAGITAGNVDDHQKTVTILEGLASQMAKAYSERMRMDPAEVRDLMRGEQWYFGSEIVEAGLADELTESPTRAGYDRDAAAMATARAFTIVPDSSYEQAAAEILDISRDGLTNEDRQAMKLMGMSAQDYRKYNGIKPATPAAQRAPAGITDEDEEAARFMGISIEEYKKYSQEVK